MSYLDNILNSENKPSLEATYKPLSSELDTLTKKGVLVHMLEFALKEELLKNFCNMLTGKFTGVASEYRIGDAAKLPENNYDPEKKQLIALTASAAREGLNRPLFTVHSRIGIIIDAAQVELIAVSPSYIYNTMLDDGLFVQHRDKTNNYDFIKANIGKTGQNPDKVGATLPLKRTEEEQKELRKVFDEKLWDAIQNDSKLAISEVISNAPLAAVKGIIYNPSFEFHSRSVKYDDFDVGSHNKLMLSNLMTAVGIRNYVEEKTGSTLPLVQYYGGTFKEIEYEPLKVKGALEKVPQYRKLFTELLGEEATKSLMSVRADIAMDSK